MIVPDGNGCIIAAAARKIGLAFDALQTEAMPMSPEAIITERCRVLGT
jgi:hypothetical protein